MKYLLKQNKENKGILCDKVTIDRFDYYVNEEKTLSNNGDWYLGHPNYDTLFKWGMFGIHEGKQVWINKVIATNNPNIDLPQVVDEVEVILDAVYPKIPSGVYGHTLIAQKRDIFLRGYNKSQETHSFSEEDLKSLLDFITNEKSEYSIMYGNQTERFSTNDKDFIIEQLIEIWKEQQPKIIYYVPA